MREENRFATQRYIPNLKDFRANGRPMAGHMAGHMAGQWPATCPAIIDVDVDVDRPRSTVDGSWAILDDCQ